MVLEFAKFREYVAARGAKFKEIRELAASKLKEMPALANWGAKAQGGKSEQHRVFGARLSGHTDAAAVRPRSIDLSSAAEFRRIKRSHDFSRNELKLGIEGKLDKIQSGAEALIRTGINKGLLDSESYFKRTGKQSFEYSIRGDRAAVDLASAIIETDRDSQFGGNGHGAAGASKARDGMLGDFYKMQPLEKSVGPVALTPVQFADVLATRKGSASLELDSPIKMGGDGYEFEATKLAVQQTQDGARLVITGTMPDFPLMGPPVELRSDPLDISYTPGDLKTNAQDFVPFATAFGELKARLRD